MEEKHTQKSDNYSLGLSTKVTKLPQEYRQQLRAPLPSEAIDSPNAQGLTPIKAAYILERLNNVFGVCGWELRHERVGFFDNTKSKKNYNTNTYESYIIKQAVVVGYIEIPELQTRTMEYYGGGDLDGVGRTPADGFKSAVTDLLSKCASTLEIGIQVFKGQPWDRSEFVSQQPPEAPSLIDADFKKIPEKLDLSEEISNKKDVVSSEGLSKLRLVELKKMLVDIGGSIDLIEKPTKAKLINAIKMINSENSINLEKASLTEKANNEDVKSKEAYSEPDNTEEVIDKKYIKEKVKIVEISNVIIPDLGEGGKRKREGSFIVWQNLNSVGIDNNSAKELIDRLGMPYTDKENLCNVGSKEDIIKILKSA